MAARKGRVKTEVIDHGKARFLEELGRAKGAHVKVGIQANEGKELKKIQYWEEIQQFKEIKKGRGKKAEIVGYEEERVQVLKKALAPVSLFWVATWNEFGTSDGRVPSRSFIRSTMKESRAFLVKATGKLWVKIIRGELTVKTSLDKLGLQIAALIQRKIVSGVSPENAPYTIARKKSSKTLVNVGQLRQGIRHIVTLGSGAKRAKSGTIDGDGGELL